jgi:membrane-bound ClpP family serine protease
MIRSIEMRTAFSALAFFFFCAATTAAEKVSLIKVDGAIGPATASYI